MREIKFRGKPIEFYSDTKWFYGSAIMNYEDRLAYIEEPGNGFVPVKWATVSEYTGLKDKNDKELFEGDVFEENYFDNEYDGQVINRYEVIFNNGAFMAKPIGVTSNKFPIYLVFMFVNKPKCHDVEILGNVYENPELLKGANENE